MEGTSSLANPPLRVLLVYGVGRGGAAGAPVVRGPVDPKSNLRLTRRSCASPPRLTAFLFKQNSWAWMPALRRAV